MPPDCQRIQKRTPATVALQISSANQPLIAELLAIAVSGVDDPVRKSGE